MSWDSWACCRVADCRASTYIAIIPLFIMLTLLADKMIIYVCNDPYNYLTTTHLILTPTWQTNICSWQANTCSCLLPDKPTLNLFLIPTWEAHTCPRLVWPRSPDVAGSHSRAGAVDRRCPSRSPVLPWLAWFRLFSASGLQCSLVFHETQEKKSAMVIESQTRSFGFLRNMTYWWHITLHCSGFAI